MRKLTFIILLSVSGCCNDYDPADPPPPPAILLNFDYHYNGFAPEDTSFSITSFEYNQPVGKVEVFYPDKKDDSSGTIKFTNIYSTEKIIIESMSSDFTDSLTNMGYKSVKEQKGNSRCSYYSTRYFNISASYRNQALSSGDGAILEINVKK